jgi:hypothetical protein
VASGFQIDFKADRQENGNLSGSSGLLFWSNSSDLGRTSDQSTLIIADGMESRVNESRNANPALIMSMPLSLDESMVH